MAMSNPTRYTINIADGRKGWEECADGGWVAWADYTALATTHAELVKIIQGRDDEIVKLKKEIRELRFEVLTGEPLENDDE